jgi:hypothetical protein
MSSCRRRRFLSRGGRRRCLLPPLAQELAAVRRQGRNLEGRGRLRRPPPRSALPRRASAARIRLPRRRSYCPSCRCQRGQRRRLVVLAEEVFDDRNLRGAPAHRNRHDRSRAATTTAMRPTSHSSSSSSSSICSSGCRDRPGLRSRYPHPHSSAAACCFGSAAPRWGQSRRRRAAHFIIFFFVRGADDEGATTAEAARPGPARPAETARCGVLRCRFSAQSHQSLVVNFVQASSSPAKRTV